jgi:hypothetical protein
LVPNEHISAALLARLAALVCVVPLHSSSQHLESAGGVTLYAVLEPDAAFLPHETKRLTQRSIQATVVTPEKYQLCWRSTREMSVRRKLNAMPAVFEGKKVLLVDDSIVRGTTMSQIVEMVRRAGAVKVGLPHRSSLYTGMKGAASASWERRSSISLTSLREHKHADAVSSACMAAERAWPPACRAMA